MIDKMILGLIVTSKVTAGWDAHVLFRSSIKSSKVSPLSNFQMTLYSISIEFNFTSSQIFVLKYFHLRPIYTRCPVKKLSLSILYDRVYRTDFYFIEWTLKPISSTEIHT